MSTICKSGPQEFHRKGAKVTKARSQILHSEPGMGRDGAERDQRAFPHVAVQGGLT
jgi:hypothetical protein